MQQLFMLSLVTIELLLLLLCEYVCIYRLDLEFIIKKKLNRKA